MDGTPGRDVRLGEELAKIFRPKLRTHAAAVIHCATISGALNKGVKLHRSSAAPRAGPRQCLSGSVSNITVLTAIIVVILVDFARFTTYRTNYDTVSKTTVIYDYVILLMNNY